MCQSGQAELHSSCIQLSKASSIFLEFTRSNAGLWQINDPLTLLWQINDPLVSKEVEMTGLIWIV